MLVQYSPCIILINNKFCHKLHKTVPVFYSFHLTHVFIRECLMVICALYMAIEGPILCSHSFVVNNEIWKVCTFISLSISCILLCDALRHSHIILFKLSVCFSVIVVPCNQYCENSSFSSTSKYFCSVHN